METLNSLTTDEISESSGIILLASGTTITVSSKFFIPLSTSLTRHTWECVSKPEWIERLYSGSSVFSGCIRQENLSDRFFNTGQFF